MTTAATTLLGLGLPVTGELSGTWGDVVNNSITNLLDTAIAGTTTLSSDADVTLTTTTLASNQARQAVILWTAGGTVTRVITAPAQSKSYVVINATSSSQSIKLVGVGPTTGITIVAGEKCFAAWNGSDFVKVGNTSGAGVFSTVTASSLTSGRVTYAGTAGLLQDAAALTFDGTTLAATKFSGALNGTVGATTPSTGAFTTVSATGVSSFSAGAVGAPSIYLSTDTTTGLYRIGANNVGFAVSGAKLLDMSSSGLTVRVAGNNTLVVDSSNVQANGTLGVTGATNLATGGVTVSTQLGTLTAPTTNALQHLFNGAAVWMGQTTAGGETDLGWNFYYNSGFKSRVSDVASRLSFNSTSGRVSFWTAPSPGSADAALTFTEALRIDATTGVTALGAMAVGNGLAVTGTLSATGQISGTNNAAAQAVFRGWNSSGGAVGSNGQIQIGSTLANCGILQYEDSGNTFVYLDSTYNSNGSYIKFRTKTSATPFDAMTIKGDGTVTMSLYGAGAATFSAAGVISSVSDETWKIKDGVPVNPDAMLKKLEPGYWYYNDEKRKTFGKDRQLGFYAQNVNAAIGPEAAPEPESYLSQDEDGKEITITKPWGYYDRSVLAVTVMSLQKALATIESLTARITALENK